MRLHGNELALRALLVLVPGAALALVGMIVGELIFRAWANELAKADLDALQAEGQGRKRPPGWSARR